MKRKFSKTAFTLIELIVAMALVSIIVLGIFSISMVLTNNSQDYSRRYLVRSETQTALNHILYNASLAIGSATNVGSPTAVADQGIEVLGPGGAGNLNTFCIHQQNNGVTIAGSTPSTDNWLCYTFDLVSTDVAYQQIYYCYVAYNVNSGTPLRGATANCGAYPETYLGTAYNVSWSFNNNSSNSGQMVFNVAIQNCLNDLVASCYNPAPALQDPVNNPEVSVSGSVTPIEEGMNQT